MARLGRGFPVQPFRRRPQLAVPSGLPSVTSTRATSWNTAAPVTSTRATTWNTLATVATANYNTTVNAITSLIGRWKLDDTTGAVAVASVGSNGAYVSSPTLAASGLVQDGGTAVTTDGAASEITVPVGTSQAAIAFWAAHGAGGAAGIPMMRDSTSTAGTGWYIDISGTNPVVRADGTNHTVTTVTASTLRTGAKHLYVLQTDGTNVTFFIDGTQVDTWVKVGTFPTAATNWHFGKNGTAASFYGGTFDDIATFNATLSTTDVANLWNNGIGGNLSRATTWSVLTAVAASTRATTWATFAAVTSTRATTWKTLASVLATRATTWSVLTSVLATRATTWNTLGAVLSTRATTWNTAAPVTATRATTWNTLATVAASTRATTWNTRAAVLSTRATTWNTAAAVTSTRATTWNTLAAVLSTRATTWRTLASVLSTRATTWNVAGNLTSVTATRATTWVVRASVSSTRATTWNVLTSTTATRATSWNVLTSTSATRATTWRVLAVVSASRSTTWVVLVGVNSNRVVLWNTLRLVTINRGTTWNTRQQITSIRATTWRVAPPGSVLVVDAVAWIQTRTSAAVGQHLVAEAVSRTRAAAVKTGASV
jgi:hypothetical protein